MEQRRFLIFLTLSMGLLIVWANLAQMLNPPQPPAEQAAPDEQAAPKEPGGQPADAAPDADPEAPEVVAENPGEPPEAVEPPQVGPVEPAAPQHPAETIDLGSLDPESGYFFQVRTSTAGGAIVGVQLSDPRYRELTNREQPLRLFGSEDNASPYSFSLVIPLLDQQLQEFGTDTATVHWKVVERVTDDQNPDVIQGVRYRLDSPDGRFAIERTYRLHNAAADSDDLRAARDSDSLGYQIRIELNIINLGDEELPFAYKLRGPLGTVLENRENARGKLRDFKVGFYEPGGSFDDATMTAAEVVETVEDGNEEVWKDPIRYTGIDTQYFAILIVPVDFQGEEPYTGSVQPVVVQKDEEEESWSEVTTLVESREFTIAARDKRTHGYIVYAGPKRQSLLEPLAQTGANGPVAIEAEEILDYGMFGWIAKGMLWLLNRLHGVGLPYGVAIIGLTILVRGCMFPLSRKQAISAQKMKELQPKIAELKTKFGNDKEKFARAQMELFSKNNYNPFAGCLPVFLQLPIFIGLYTALNASIDLRMADFLYIDNLAAPDRIGPNWLRGVPFIGPDLNLLPLITVGLFIVQQKMFMPPPTDEQQAMQQKIMNVMMIVIGFMFYRVPAGLCVYFIASSLWGMAERKLLDIYKPKAKEASAVAAAAAPAAPAVRASGNGNQASNRRKGKSKKRRKR